MATSLCASGVDVDFYWRGCKGTTTDDHIRAATHALLEALGARHRVLWNPWNRSMIRAEIEDRLKQASRGELKPVDQVKVLRAGRGSLFEIRWQDIEITVREPDGSYRYERVNLRLITAEPFELSRTVIGLVAFEKPKSPVGKSLQDEAIDEAERLYSAGYRRGWGVQFR